MEEKNDINKILEMLNESVTSGLYFEIRAEDSKTLLEYINEQTKQIGIEKTISGMRLNDIHSLSSELDRTKIRADLLNDKLNRTEIIQQENRKMELENDIKNKLYYIDKYNKAIERIEEILRDTLPDYYG